MINKIKKFKVLICFLIISSFMVTFFNPRSALSITKPKYVSVDKQRKKVYLTFDDGPTTVVTNNILDVLKKYNVKATFFVVGKEIDGREKVLNRIYKEGHSIGLHTYSHNLKKIYSNEDIFIDEMIRTQKKIRALTGFNSNIIRFPGGSYNHLNSKFLSKLHKNNFKIYDWNVCLEDGVDPNLPVNSLINNSKKFSQSYNRLIVLAHCNSNNENTVKALPGIIEYYKNLGYEFDTIQNNTKEYYFKFKK